MNIHHPSLGPLGPRAAAVCQALSAEVDKLGFEPGTIAIGQPETARFRLDPDPASGDHSLLGEWRDGHGNRVGMIVFHADGSFFAEHDVVRAHPRNGRWFVEAVNAWGRNRRITAEPRLLQMPA